MVLISVCLKELLFWLGSHFSQVLYGETNCYKVLWELELKDNWQSANNNQIFYYICVHLFLKFVLFSQSHIGTPSTYFILLWWIIRRDLEVSSEFPFLLVCVNQFSVIALLFCGFLSSRSTAFVCRAFSKIKQLPHWQYFWILSAKLFTYRLQKAI